jgi:hypothetical protein
MPEHAARVLRLGGCPSGEESSGLYRLAQVRTNRDPPYALLRLVLPGRHAATAENPCLPAHTRLPVARSASAKQSDLLEGHAPHVQNETANERDEPGV